MGITDYMQDSRFQQFEISHPMHCSQEHPLHFTETKTTTPNRTKSLGTVHAVHGLQKRGRVKFVCAGGKTLRFWQGLNLSEIFRAFLPCQTPHIPTEGLSETDSPSAYFFSSIIPYNFISSMRSFASLMEPDALLSAPDCSPA